MLLCMVHGDPILWVKNDRDSHRVVSDEQGTRLEPTGGPAVRIVMSLILLVAASMFLGTSASIIPVSYTHLRAHETV